MLQNASGTGLRHYALTSMHEITSKRQAPWHDNKSELIKIDYDEAAKFLS